MNLTESARLFAGPSFLRNFETGGGDDDGGEEGGGGIDASATSVGVPDENVRRASRQEMPSDDDGEGRRDGSDSPKAGQDTAQESPSASSPASVDKSLVRRDTAPTSNAGGNTAGPFGAGAVDRGANPFLDDSGDEESDLVNDAGQLTPEDIEEWHSASTRVRHHFCLD